MALNKGPINLDTLLSMANEGKSLNQIAEELGRSRSNVQMYWRQLNRINEAAKASESPPIEAVPVGFHLSSISTTVDASGKTKSQSYKAKSGDEGDVVPDSGSFPAPDGMFVRSVSTLVDGQTGAIKQQWVKSDIIKEEKFKAMVEASSRAAAEKLVPVELIQEPQVFNNELCTLYTLTDCHVGMLAWERETGEAWDLSIAENVLVKTFQQMILSSPASATCIINQLGDFLHFDSLSPVTPMHGHLLDADSRYQKVVSVAVRILRRIIELALRKHQTIMVYMHEGNHDMAGSVWLRVLFSALYEDNPRVNVEQSPLPYVAYKHGKTMLGFHHGHLSKNSELPEIFSARFREMWGGCPKVYIHTGHRHSVEEKEYPGAKVIQHPTLSASDAYAARNGWVSERQASFITYHREHGEIGRGTFLPVV